MFITKPTLSLKVKFILSLLIIIFSIIIYFSLGNLKKHLKQEFISLNTGISNVNYLTKDNFIDILYSIFSSHETLNVDVDLESLKVIEKDRQLAISRGILYDANEVPAKISFKNKTYKATVSLKGDLIVHWSTQRRMSLKVKLKDGFIMGFKRFSIQTPSARQYPDNDIFLKLAKNIDVLSNEMKFVSVKFNGQKWGKMNVEQIVDKYYLETNGKKESLVLKFDDQPEWNYRIASKKNGTYTPQYKAFDMLFDINVMQDKKFKKSSEKKQYFSYLIESLRQKDEKIVLREKFCKAVVLGELWENYHALAFSNSRFYFNPYTLKIEPILSDQGNIFLRTDEIELDKRFYREMEIYKLIINLPNNEYENCITRALEELNSKKYVLNDVREKVQKYFPNNPIIEMKELEKNLDFITKNFRRVFLSKNETKEKLPSNITFNSNQLGSTKDWLGINQFDDGTLWILNRLPVELKIKEIKNGDESLKISKSGLILLPQKKTLMGLHPSSFISKPLILNTNFSNFKKPVSIVAEVLGETKKFKSHMILPNYSSLINPLIETQSKNLPKGIEKVGKNCFIKSYSNLTISNSITLNCNLHISEGSNLFFSNKSYLIIKGTLNINGTVDQPVIMTSGDSQDWRGLYVIGGGSASKLTNLKISNVSQLSDGMLKLTGALTFYNTNLSIKGLFISKITAEDALNIVNSKFNISNIDIRNTKSDAIDFDFSKGTVHNSSFKKIGGDALDFSGSKVELEKINISVVKDKALSIGEKTFLEGNNLNVKNASVGIATKDGSIANIKKVTFISSKHYDLMTYNKKKFYSPPKMYVKNPANCDFIHSRSADSLLYCNDNLLSAKIEDIEKLYKSGFMRKNGKSEN